MGKPLNDEGSVEYGVGDQARELGHVEQRRICENLISVRDGGRGRAHLAQDYCGALGALVVHVLQETGLNTSPVRRTRI